MFSNKLYSPLRYPGGKASFAPYIASIMKGNNLSKGHYWEPYAGGAGVALYLLFEGHASHIHINDADPAIFAFWTSVTKHPLELLELIESTPISIEEWFKWRAVLRGESPASIVERGFATLFMNRTNRSGILKAGVIGGKNQSGAYKLDARFKKDVICSRIKQIAKYSSNISVYCEDSLELLNNISNNLPEKSLIYLDPPYYVKGKGLYRNYYEHNDHVKIANVLQNEDTQWNWVVSYDNTDEICKMYEMSHSLEYGLNYSAQRSYVGNEVMFFSKNLKVAYEFLPHAKSCA